MHRIACSAPRQLTSHQVVSHPPGPTAGVVWLFASWRKKDRAFKEYLERVSLVVEETKQFLNREQVVCLLVLIAIFGWSPAHPIMYLVHEAVFRSFKSLPSLVHRILCAQRSAPTPRFSYDVIYWQRICHLECEHATTPRV